jgi:hypothetical protein
MARRAVQMAPALRCKPASTSALADSSADAFVKATGAAPVRNLRRRAHQEADSLPDAAIGESRIAVPCSQHGMVTSGQRNLAVADGARGTTKRRKQALASTAGHKSDGGGGPGPDPRTTRNTARDAAESTKGQGAIRRGQRGSASPLAMTLPSSDYVSSSTATQQVHLSGLQAKALRIWAQLDQLYPDPAIPLHHSSSFQLLVAVVLSAQVRAWRGGGSQ